MIDIRYWAYTAADGLYAPEGGKNLTPRQHLRQTKQRPGGFSAIVKAVREYRMRFPEKAVTYYADMNCPSSRDGWAVLVGGGSLPNLKLPEQLAKAIPTLRPADGIVSGDNQWCLASADRDYVIYTATVGEQIKASFPGDSSDYRVHWIDTNSGELQSADKVTADQSVRLLAKTNVLWLETTKSK